MTSALKTDMQQVSAPHLCKKLALVVQLNQIQPRLVRLALRWRDLCTTTIATTASWPQDKDVHVHTRPAAHLEDTSPTSNLGRAPLRRVTLPRVIALRSELIQRPTKYLVVEGEKNAHCVLSLWMGETGANSWDIPMSLRCVQRVRPKACLPLEGWREQRRFEKGGKRLEEGDNLIRFTERYERSKWEMEPQHAVQRRVSKASRWPQRLRKENLGKHPSKQTAVLNALTRKRALCN